MKMAAKVLIGGGILLASASTAATAADLLPPPLPEPVAEASCLYFRVDGGASFHERPNVYKNHGGKKNKAIGEKLKDSGFVEGGVGCQFTPMFRADIVGGYRFNTKMDNKYNDLDATLSTGTIFANGYIDLDYFGFVKPYVGGGVGVAFHHIGDVDMPILSGSGSSTDFAWNVQAGLAFDVTENIALDVGYRYVDLGDAKSGGKDPFHVDNITAHEARVGIRFKLN
ncbi:outer membrane protein [Rhodoligotrophos ferricapiens]|uniref:outer membrane protein n=1 Tax=Rhodoligotrophos ferricapiens TaxID=3069264 RepID=UPI00315CBBF1